MASTCESIPVLYIKAETNFDVGYQIGKTFKHFICEHNSSGTANYLNSFYETDEGRNLYNSSLAATEKCYPHIVEEIRGMAEGSDVPFEKLFLQNMVSEILLHHSNSAQKKVNEENSEIAGCSDIMVNNEQCRVLAHNEDWGSEVKRILFMVDVDLDKPSSDKTSSRSEDLGNGKIGEQLPGRNERYLSLMFPGYLAGNTFYVNKSFAASVNSLVPKHVNTGAVPVDILMRAMVGCESIEECVDVMRNDPIGCSYGININIASRVSPEMWSLEVYPDKGKTVVDLHRIPYSIRPDIGPQYVHTNHYKHTDNAEESPRLVGSKAREARAAEISIPSCVQDVCSILGDTSSPIEPIYRTPGKSFYSKHVATVATAVFDMTGDVLHVYLGNPKTAKKPCLSLPFIN